MRGLEKPTYFGIFEDNDPRKRMLALVNYNSDLAEYWEYAATGYLVTLTEPEAGDVVTENVPVRLSETPGRVRGLAPLMGEHTHEIARNLLGLSDDEIKKLDEEKVLY